MRPTQRLYFPREPERVGMERVMPRWAVVHKAGVLGNVDAELVTAMRPVDSRAPIQHGTLLTLRDGTEVRVDEAVSVMRTVLRWPD